MSQVCSWHGQPGSAIQLTVLNYEDGFQSKAAFLHCKHAISKVHIVVTIRLRSRSFAMALDFLDISCKYITIISMIVTFDHIVCLLLRLVLSIRWRPEHLLELVLRIRCSYAKLLNLLHLSCLVPPGPVSLVLDGAIGVAVEAGILHRPILRYLIRNTGLVSVVMIWLLDLDEGNLHNLVDRFIEKSICIVLVSDLASW